MRIILYTGKGGVGKTSVAAATALRCADLGYRTVVISTDAAHSLSDSFDLPLGPEPTDIAPNLWGQEIDILHQMDKYWGTVQDWLSSVLTWRGMDEIIAEETTVLPGMEELTSLLQISLLHDSGDFDAIIVDCAPTGETLRFLSFPEVANWYLRRIFPIERRAAQIAGPLLRSLADLPVPQDPVFESIKSLLTQLNHMHELLTDPQKSSVRLVLNPEKMVIKEAQRTFTYLNLFGFATDLIISNRIIPERVEDSYFAAWKGIQEKYGLLVEEAFSPLSILKVPLFDQEVIGLDMLRRMADSTYGDEDPTQVFFVGQAHTLDKQDGQYRLSLRLPFASKEDIGLSRWRDELIIRIGNYKRNLILPRVLVNQDVKQARLEGDTLAIVFGNKRQT